MTSNLAHFPSLMCEVRCAPLLTHMSLLEQAEVKTPLPPPSWFDVATFRGIIFRAGSLASFGDYHRRRLRRQARPEGGPVSTRTTTCPPLLWLPRRVASRRRTNKWTESIEVTAADVSGVKIVFRSRRHFRPVRRRVRHLRRSSLAFVKTAAAATAISFARAQFVIRQLVRAKMKRLKKVACSLRVCQSANRRKHLASIFGTRPWRVRVRALRLAVVVGLQICPFRF